MSNWVSVVKSVEKGRMGWGRPSSGLLNSCSSISSPEPEAWRTLQGNALGSHGRTGGWGMGPGVLELSNLSAGKSSGLGSVTVKAVCGLSCPFCHLLVAAPVSQLRRARLSGRGSIPLCLHPTLLIRTPPCPQAPELSSGEESAWTGLLVSAVCPGIYCVFTDSHLYGGDCRHPLLGSTL